MAKKPEKSVNRNSQKLIEQYEYKDKKRLNYPSVGLIETRMNKGRLKEKTYRYDPHLASQFILAGKAEHTFPLNSIPFRSTYTIRIGG